MAIGGYPDLEWSGEYACFVARVQALVRAIQRRRRHWRGTSPRTGLRLSTGGTVIGVIPQSLVSKKVAHSRLSDLRVVGSMHERKARMAELSDAFIALPGGYGTFEEFCEVLTWTQLGLQRKPCGILNIDGYYDQLLSLFDHAVDEQFLKPVHRRMVFSDSRPECLVSRLLEYELPSVDKSIDLKQT
jgi:uncharacterized protein (TIGR00730 family)